MGEEIMHKIDNEVREKNRIYRKKDRSKAKYIGMGLIVCVYLFFFFSNMIIPQQMTDKSGTTKIGEPYAFAENRTVDLIRADYSEEQEIMEVLLHFSNTNYDNVDEYYYALELAGASTKGLKVEQRFNEELFTVLRIRDVPKHYREMILYFAPKTVPMNEVTDEITGSVILNKYNVTNKRVDMSKTKTDYLKERLNSVIQYYEDILQYQEKIMADYETNLTALKKENEEILDNRKYMTESEIEKEEAVMMDNEDQLMEVRESIKIQAAKIAATKKEIQEAREKRDQLHP